MWRQADPLVVASVGYVEIVSAISRRLHGQRQRHARRWLERYWDEVFVIDVDETLVRSAADLGERHRLRALDAIHLAAGRVSAVDEDFVFVTWDHELSAAARAEGMAVAP